MPLNILQGIAVPTLLSHCAEEFGKVQGGEFTPALQACKGRESGGCKRSRHWGCAAAHVQVATLICADWLVLLTDVDALYTANPATDPAAQPIYEVADLSQLHVRIPAR